MNENNSKQIQIVYNFENSLITKLMNEFNGLGKMFIILGALFLIAGIVIILCGKFPFLGKLPGDFSWKGKNWNIYFPLGTSILLSILLSIILFIIKKFNP